MQPQQRSLAEEGAQKAVNCLQESPALRSVRGSTWAILCRITWLAALSALRKEELRRSCFPSRKYFSRVFELNVCTVSAITTKLADLGLIVKTQRRPINGQFQTNMYQLAGYVWGKVKEVLKGFIKRLNRVGYTQHIVTKTKKVSLFKEIITVNNKSPDNSDYQAVLYRLKESAQKIGRWGGATT